MSRPIEIISPNDITASLSNGAYGKLRVEGSERELFYLRDGFNKFDIRKPVPADRMGGFRGRDTGGATTAAGYRSYSIADNFPSLKTEMEDGEYCLVFENFRDFEEKIMADLSKKTAQKVDSLFISLSGPGSFMGTLKEENFNEFCQSDKSEQRLSIVARQLSPSTMPSTAEGAATLGGSLSSSHLK